MTKPCEAPYGGADPERIIVALDVDNAEKAREIVGELTGHVGAFKIGMQLFNAEGPAFVRELTSAGHKIFLDLKYHDIPNTVAGAAVEATRMGVWMFNIHASGGSEMMQRTVEAVDEVCTRENLKRPLIIGVTVLTSTGDDELMEIGIAGSGEEAVIRLAKLTDSAGLDGVVASPNEAAAIRSSIENKDFVIVTPGIRQASATKDDQRRVNTFRQALANGSSYAVIGRPVTASTDMVAAVNEICSEND